MQITFSEIAPLQIVHPRSAFCYCVVAFELGDPPTSGCVKVVWAKIDLHSAAYRETSGSVSLLVDFNDDLDLSSSNLFKCRVLRERVLRKNLLVLNPNE